MSKEVSEVLFKAAQLIERDGHCKFQVEDDRGRHCLAGAISKSISGFATNWDGQSERVGAEFSRALGFKDIYAAADWNNADERTAEEVIDALVIASVEATQEDF